MLTTSLSDLHYATIAVIPTVWVTFLGPSFIPSSLNLQTYTSEQWIFHEQIWLMNKCIQDNVQLLNWEQDTPIPNEMTLAKLLWYMNFLFTDIANEQV